MELVTLLTDSGDQDHYVAAIKARILSLNPELKIIDISHRIVPGNIAQAIFVIRSVFRDFPAGTVHLVGVDSIAMSIESYVACSIEQHYFVAPDNGILSLISEIPPRQVVAINSDSPIKSTFPEKDILAPVVAKLASGSELFEIGRPMNSLARLTQRQLKTSQKQILGFILHVDGQGNLITNITKSAFDQFGLGRKFTVRFGREHASRIQDFYHESEPGDCFVIFNSLGLMEVGINRGNASRLLGLGPDSPINVLFEE